MTASPPATTTVAAAPLNSPAIDLTARARQAMIDEDFAVDLPRDAIRQLVELEAAGMPRTADGSVRDLRRLLWSSIDNADSRDLDQVEWVERLPNGDIRVMVGIADVDCCVPAGSPLDTHAALNSCTVYTGVAIFPMLPTPVSTGLTSLNAYQDRLAVIIEMVVADDGTISGSDVYRAWLRNHAALAYEIIGPWLEGATSVPPPVASVPGLEEQLRLQDEAAQRLRARRQREGALEFDSTEARPILLPSGRVGIDLSPRNRANTLIENFMVSANTVMAQFLADHGVAAIQRVVKKPERWNRIVAIAQSVGDAVPDEADPVALSAFLQRRRVADPDRFPDLSLSIVKLLGPGQYALVRPGEHGGHFGLAATSYTHSTAPNRRYADLVTQRLVKATLAQAMPPYSESDLDALARHCTEREDAARKVERVMRKVTAAVFLSSQVGETYDAIVTGANRKGVFVRVESPPVEGRVVQGEEGLDVGDKVRVRLIATDPAQGFIDFALSPP